MVRHSIKEQLILHEGLRLKVYKCTANKWTIGVGRNLEDVGLSKAEQVEILGVSGLNRLEVIDVLLERGITEEQAMYLLDNDIAKCTADVKQFPWFENLNPVRQKVIIDMCLNLGFAGLKDFKRMILALEQGDYETASEEMKDSKWYYQVGIRGRRLVKMMKTGEDYV